MVLHVHQQRELLNGGPIPIATGSWSGCLDDVTGRGGKTHAPVQVRPMPNPHLLSTTRDEEAGSGGPFIELRVESSERADVARYFSRCVQGSADSEEESETDEDDDQSNGNSDAEECKGGAGAGLLGGTVTGTTAGPGTTMGRAGQSGAALDIPPAAVDTAPKPPLPRPPTIAEGRSARALAMQSKSANAAARAAAAKASNGPLEAQKAAAELAATEALAASIVVHEGVYSVAVHVVEARASGHRPRGCRRCSGRGCQTPSWP